MQFVRICLSGVKKEREREGGREGGRERERERERRERERERREREREMERERERERGGGGGRGGESLDSTTFKYVHQDCTNCSFFEEGFDLSKLKEIRADRNDGFLTKNMLFFFHEKDV